MTPPTTLSEEDKELLKNYEVIAETLYEQKDFIGLFVLLNSVVKAKNLEAEIKVEEAVRGHNKILDEIASQLRRPHQKLEKAVEDAVRAERERCGKIADEAKIDGKFNDHWRNGFQAARTQIHQKILEPPKD